MLLRMPQKAEKEVRAGMLEFKEKWGSHMNYMNSGMPWNSYIFGHQCEDYRPEYGYGDEASRPPDY